MIHSMSRQHFPWAKQSKTIYVFVFIWIVYQVISYIMYSNYDYDSAEGPILGKVFFVHDMFTTLVSFGLMWVVPVVCELYKQSQCCACSVAKHVFHPSSGIENPLQALTDAEYHVTVAFQRARKWVAIAVLGGILGVVYAVLAITQLMFLAPGQSQLVLPVINLFVGSLLAWCFIAPIAFVNEVHVVECMRELNNPLTLKGSIDMVGCSIIGHVSSLDWSFRFCGSTIDHQKLSNIVIALVLSVVTALSSKVLSLMEVM